MHRRGTWPGLIAVGSGELRSSQFLARLVSQLSRRRTRLVDFCLVQRQLRQHQRTHRAGAAGCGPFAGTGGHHKIQFCPHAGAGAVGRFGAGTMGSWRAKGGRLPRRIWPVRPLILPERESRPAMNCSTGLAPMRSRSAGSLPPGTCSIIWRLWPGKAAAVCSR